jgi:hypothetical protein
MLIRLFVGPPVAMKRLSPLLPALMLGATAASHAFTLDIASHDIAEFGQGPRLVFVPGYGEVVFESGLDGVLVVGSAYASTDRIEMPPVAAEAAAETSHPNAGPDADSGFVKITSRATSELPLSLHPVDAALQNPPDGWNAVPEAASAALGLVGTLMLLLRRRVNSESKAQEKP